MRFLNNFFLQSFMNRASLAASSDSTQKEISSVWWDLANKLAILGFFLSTWAIFHGDFSNVFGEIKKTWAFFFSQSGNSGYTGGLKLKSEVFK